MVKIQFDTNILKDNTNFSTSNWGKIDIQVEQTADSQGWRLTTTNTHGRIVQGKAVNSLCNGAYFLLQKGIVFYRFRIIYRNKTGSWKLQLQDGFDRESRYLNYSSSEWQQEEFTGYTYGDENNFGISLIGSTSNISIEVQKIELEIYDISRLRNCIKVDEEFPLSCFSKFDEEVINNTFITGNFMQDYIVRKSKHQKIRIEAQLEILEDEYKTFFDFFRLHGDFKPFVVKIPLNNKDLYTIKDLTIVRASHTKITEIENQAVVVYENNISPVLAVPYKSDYCKLETQERRYKVRVDESSKIENRKGKLYIVSFDLVETCS